MSERKIKGVSHNVQMFIKRHLSGRKREQKLIMGNKIHTKEWCSKRDSELL